MESLNLQVGSLLPIDILFYLALIFCIREFTDLQLKFTSFHVTILISQVCAMKRSTE